MFKAAKQTLSKLAPSAPTMSSSLAPSPVPQYIYKILPQSVENSGEGVMAPCGGGWS